MISHHHNDPLVKHFGIDKTKELISWKYYWPSLKKDVKAYIRGYDICLPLKAIRYKPYKDLQFLLVLIYQWKNFSIDFVIGLLLSLDWKDNSYKIIFVIVDRLIKMIYYELVKITIDVLGLAEVIIEVVIQYYGLPDSIISDHEAIFTSKFWSSLYYFFGIKKWLSTTFHP